MFVPEPRIVLYALTDGTDVGQRCDDALRSGPWWWAAHMPHDIITDLIEQRPTARTLHLAVANQLAALPRSRSVSGADTIVEALRIMDLSPMTLSAAMYAAAASERDLPIACLDDATAALFGEFTATRVI